MLSGRSSLYVISSKIFIILKGSSLAKFNLLLSFVVWTNVIFVFSVLYKRYTLFLFLRVSSWTLFLLVNFFITLLKNVKLCRNFFGNLWISSIYNIVCNLNSSHSLISSETSASNPLFIKNGVLLVVLYLEVLYISILIGNSLTQLVY